MEDHSFDYRSFEGIIPEGHYGAGKVLIWDQGTYTISREDSYQANEMLMREGLKKGQVNIILKGRKLQGEFSLIRLRGEQNKHWLLIKKKDAFAILKDARQSS